MLLESLTIPLSLPVNMFLEYHLLLQSIHRLLQCYHPPRGLQSLHLDKQSQTIISSASVSPAAWWKT